MLEWYVQEVGKEVKPGKYEPIGSPEFVRAENWQNMLKSLSKRYPMFVKQSDDKKVEWLQMRGKDGNMIEIPAVIVEFLLLDGSIRRFLTLPPRTPKTQVN